jgi:Uma2 family endonuclease
MPAALAPPTAKTLAEPLPLLAPDLAVEILSASNTEAEMRRKVREYFEAGSRLVWLVDPESRTARVFTGPELFSIVAEGGELDGGPVLPGFRVSLRQWFERAGPH